MKTFRFSVFAFVFISFISCSKDEAGPPKLDSADMTGEWNLENLDYERLLK